MSNKILKYFFAVFAILSSSQIFCQSPNSIRELDDNFGRTGRHFSLGINTFDLPDKISIRADELTYQQIEALLKDNHFYIQLDERNPYIWSMKGYKDYDFGIDSTGNVKSNPELHVDLDLQDPKGIMNCLISFGNANILNKAKIEQLIFGYFSGRIMNLNEFTQLKSLVIQERIEDLNDFSMHYQGDPFLLNEVSELAYLENFVFHYSYYDYKFDIYFIDGPRKKLFELPNLKSISLTGVPYLPIPGHEWEKIEYFHTVDIFFPELINLALVFKHFDKDTNYCNWHKFLKYGNDSIPLIIPQNGKYQTFYKNGETLCEGNYINGLPDGEWNFWYEDGKLCEHRIYEEGKREGSWYFLVPSLEYHAAIDTILKLEYKNDTLIYRQDREVEHIDGSDGCSHLDYHGLAISALFVSDCKIEYKQNREITIIKEKRRYNLETPVPYVQIPAGSLEIWEFSQDGWTYKSEDYCNQKKDIQSVFLKGRKGENAYYSCRIYVRVSSTGEIYKEENIIDFQNCFTRTSKYIAENDTAQFKLRGEPREYLPAEYLPCVKW